MDANFGIPPQSDEAARLIGQRLAAAKNDDGARITIEWRGEQRHLYVVSVPLAILYLNPDTHRVRAQRTLDPDRNAVLNREPWSEEAQEYLAHLLRSRPANPGQVDPDFVQLREELEESGQKEPGIITPQGILVDGNTRCVALRDLGAKDIRVGVLPQDTDRRDINNVELYLQLRHDKRREYSYINRLIAIEEELSLGAREEDVARAFNIKIPTLRNDRGVYALIRDAISRSEGANGVRLRWTDFEEHQEKLRELQRDYAKLAKSNPDGAEQLRESRLALVVLNFPKTSLRNANEDFYTRYVEERLPERLRPDDTEAASAVKIPGLAGVSVKDAAVAARRARQLTDLLLQAKAASLDLQKPNEKAAMMIEEASRVIGSAVRLANQSADLNKRKGAVQERLSEAADYIKQCTSEFAEAKAKRALDEEAFDEALLTLRESLFMLARQVGRTFGDSGEGVAWLLDASRV
ncbi:MAG: ParB N-terminal domain-containing protein [Jatrophihabitans sp.]|uniref:ParB N-terminal domain-containing protein n=1 Tax=Jatrophihabitans sp. TaxID=1932789 RepID=UPI003F81C68C